MGIGDSNLSRADLSPETPQQTGDSLVQATNWGEIAQQANGPSTVYQQRPGFQNSQPTERYPISPLGRPLSSAPDQGTTSRYPTINPYNPSTAPYGLGGQQGGAPYPIDAGQRSPAAPGAGNGAFQPIVPMQAPRPMAARPGVPQQREQAPQETSSFHATSIPELGVQAGASWVVHTKLFPGMGTGARDANLLSKDNYNAVRRPLSNFLDVSDDYQKTLFRQFGGLDSEVNRIGKNLGINNFANDVGEAGAYQSLTDAQKTAQEAESKDALARVDKVLKSPELSEQEAQTIKQYMAYKKELTPIADHAERLAPIIKQEVPATFDALRPPVPTLSRSAFDTNGDQLRALEYAKEASPLEEGRLAGTLAEQAKLRNAEVAGLASKNIATLGLAFGGDFLMDRTWFKGTNPGMYTFAFDTASAFVSLAPFGMPVKLGAMWFMHALGMGLDGQAADKSARSKLPF